MSRETLWNGVVMEHPRQLFRLGTDSVALADFVRCRRGAKVCDLGTGSGAIALMLLAGDPSLQVWGLEILPEAAALARENAARNGLSASFHVTEGDLRQIRSLLPANSFSCVVANPPYFPADSLAPKSEALAVARTEVCCTPEDLCAAAAWLLQSSGSFFVVHRPERLADLIFAMKNHRLEPKRLQFIRHSAKSRRSLVLLEAVLDGKSGLSLMEDLLLYDEHGSPTEDFLRMYHRQRSDA